MRKVFLFFCAAMVVMSVSATAADRPDAGKAASKFSRGVTNVATCWGEYIIQLPTAIEQSPDYLTGGVYDVVRGTGFTIRRAAVGLYDIVTCPFPGRTNYKSLIQPETIFTKSVEPLTK